MTTFNAQFVQRILDNIQARLEDNLNDQVAGIDPELPLFSTETDSTGLKIGFNTATPIALNFPAVYLEPSASTLAQSADDTRIQQSHELVISLAITGPSAATLKSQVVKYVTALDRCIRRATPAQICGGLDASVNGLVWEVTEHRYGELRVSGENATIYRRDAQLIITIQLFER